MTSTEIETAAPTNTKMMAASFYRTHARDATASLICGLTFVIGFAMYTTVLSDVVKDHDDDYGSIVKGKIENLEAVRDNRTLYQFSMAVLYLLFGASQLTLSLGLSERYRQQFPESAKHIHAYGLVWTVLVVASGMIAMLGVETALELLADGNDNGGNDADREAAALFYTVIGTVSSAIGGGNEVVGAIWVLMVSYCEYCLTSGGNKKKNRCLTLSVTVVGVVSGLAGLVTVAPALTDAGAAFGIGKIVWYVLTAVILFTGRNDENNNSTDQGKTTVVAEEA